MTDLKDRFDDLFEGEPGAPDDIDRVVAAGRRAARRRTALTAAVGGAAVATVAAGVAVPLAVVGGTGSTPGTIRVGAQPSPSQPAPTKCAALRSGAAATTMPPAYYIRRAHGVVMVCTTGPGPIPSASASPTHVARPRYHYTESPQSISARLGDHFAARVGSFGLAITYTRPFAQESSTLGSGHPTYYGGNVDVREAHGYGDIGVQVIHKVTTQVPFDGPCPATWPSRCEQTTLPDGSVLRTGRVPAGAHDVVLTAEVARPDGVVVQAQESNYPFGPDAAAEAHGGQPLSLSQLVSLAEDPKFTF